MEREIKINEQKQIILTMMDEIDKFCREHNIRYCLAYGTLLGQIRHKGFIPWDDDFDIMMPREDYERFVQSFNSKSDIYKVLHHSTDHKYYYPFAKIIDTRTVLKEEGVMTQTDLGVYIDIFPLDFLGNDKNRAFMQISKKLKKWKTLNTIKLMDINKKRSFHKQCMVALLKGITKIVPWTYVLNKMNEVAMTYCDVKNPQYSAIIIDMRNIREVVETELFSSNARGEFEGHMYNIPKSYDEILTSWYGDYMTLPPEEERVSPHQYKVYWK